MIDEDLRDRLIAAPDALLNDREIVAALIGASERARGENVLDLRAVAMQRLEARLDRLEDMHRTVIAAAYDNLAGTNQVQRLVLRLLEAADFNGFLAVLDGDAASVLRVEAVRLVLETGLSADDPAGRPGSGVVAMVPVGFIAAHLGAGRGVAPREVTLRAAPRGPSIYGEAGGVVRSEALMPLDLGEGHAAAMLALGASDPQQFRPGQGTDLLAFLAGVVERVMRRWLA